MRLVLLASGRMREAYARQAQALYLKRISALAPFELIEVPERDGADAASSGRALNARLRDGDKVVLLAPDGVELTTEEFARRIGRALAEGRGRFVLVVGGPYGVGQGLSARADERISLGPMTFSHELARVVLLEQIYRALTILRGMPYHHGGG